MAQFHFVEDYEKLVAKLVQTRPIDQAMSEAVGGGYEIFGKIEAQLLIQSGLKNGMRLVDLGCGSGRLSTALHSSMDISYLGIDIVQALLDYAKSKAPSYEFILNRQLMIPQSDNSVDMVSAFSLFTHLLHAETYIYMGESLRILKPNGRLVFSFLEFADPGHWEVFSQTCGATKKEILPHLNMFIEKSVISLWAEKLGFVVDQFLSRSCPIVDAHCLGQSIAVLRKPF